MVLTPHADCVGRSYHKFKPADFKQLGFLLYFVINSVLKFYTMYSISYLINHVCIIYIECVNSSSWLGLAGIVLFIILTVL